MASLNKVVLIGNLGRDPETRQLPSGGAVCNFSIATTESWKDKQTGQKQEKTEWHNIVMFGKLAEIAAQYLRKGSSVYVEGRLQTRKWQDKTTGADRYSTEINADQMQMLDGKDRGHAQESTPPHTYNPGPEIASSRPVQQENSQGSRKQSPVKDYDIPFISGLPGDDRLHKYGRNK